MSDSTPPSTDEVEGATPPPGDEPRLEEAGESGDRSSQALSEAGDLASSVSSLSVSTGSVYALPEDFDIKHYESDTSVSMVIKIQAFIRKMSVQRHYDLISTTNTRFLRFNTPLSCHLPTMNIPR